MGVGRQSVVRVLGDPVMAVAALPVGVHVHAHASDVRHVMEKAVADLLRDRVRFGDRPLRRHADAQVDMQTVPDPSGPDVRDLTNVRHVPGRVRDRLHGVSVDAIEVAHEDGAVRLTAEPHDRDGDQAVGTATFLYFVIEQINAKFETQKGAWDSYVGSHMLGRLFGFELLMAPYAVAHLKIGMQLEQTGYHFRSDQRLGIYLTNTLEEAIKKSEKLFEKWISDEANEAAAIKREKPILVVLGNPPYSGQSANRS
jgi:hypothetical protein